MKHIIYIFIPVIRRVSSSRVEYPFTLRVTGETIDIQKHIPQIYPFTLRVTGIDTLLLYE